MWAGMRYVRFAPPIHSVLLRSGSFIISASALWSLLPLVAKVDLHRDSTGYGVLLGCLGVGSILGALMLHRLRQIFSLDTMVTASVALFGVVNVLMAYLTSYGAVALSLVVTGIAWMTVNSTLTTATQTSVPSWVRARALAVYLLVFQGAMAVGSVIWGVVATHIGLRNTLLCAGIALLIAAAATFRLKLAGLRELDTRPSGHWPEPILVLERHEEHGPVLVTWNTRSIQPLPATSPTPCSSCAGSDAAMEPFVGGCLKTPRRMAVTSRRLWWRAGPSTCASTSA